MDIQTLIDNNTSGDIAELNREAYKFGLSNQLRDALRKMAKVEAIENIIGPERIVTFHLSGHQLSDKGLIGFSGMVRYESMTETQLDKFISKLKLWKRLSLLRFFM